MKVVEKRNLVKTNLPSEQFKISASSWMYSTLIRKLYNNPYQAVLRELSTNAYDAHVEAGCPEKPFDVRFPNMDNTFYIRDYGPGMSKEKVRYIYSIIGESDKRDDNSKTGCFGLGSKTPYAITDSFTVESWHDGVHYTYMMYLDDQNIPAYSLISEKKSSEPSGLKITIKDPNASNIVSYAQIYKHFKVKPNLIDSNIVIKDCDYSLCDPDIFGVYKKPKYGSYYVSKNVNLIMGQVAYNIGTQADSLIDPKYTKLLSLDIDLFFKIGELNITPSRESVELDKRTVANINNKLGQVDKFLSEKIEAEISSCPSLFDARFKLSQIRSSIGFGYIPKSIKYDGREINDCVILKKNNSDPNSKTVEYFSARDKYSTISELLFRDRVKYYINDSTNALKRCKNDNDYWILFSFEDDAEKQEFLDLIGANDDSIFIKTSTLPNIQSAPRNNLKCSVYENFDWNPKVVDLNKGGYYVCTYQFDCIYNNKKVYNTSLLDAVKFLKSNNINIDEIVGVKKAYEQTFLKKGNGKWTNIFDLTEKTLKSKYDNTTISYMSSPYTSYISETNYNILKKNKTKLAQEIENIINKNSSFDGNFILKLSDSLGLKINIVKEDLSKELVDLLKKYPLTSFAYRGLDNHSIGYINAVDNKLI